MISRGSVELMDMVKERTKDYVNDAIMSFG